MKSDNILSVYKINIHQHLLFMHRFTSHDNPNNFSSYFNPVNNRSYRLRSNSTNNLKIPLVKNKKSEFCISYRGPKIWNSNEFKHINKEESYKIYKNLTKHHLLEN